MSVRFEIELTKTHIVVSINDNPRRARDLVHRTRNLRPRFIYDTLSTPDETSTCDDRAAHVCIHLAMDGWMLPAIRPQCH